VTYNPDFKVTIIQRQITRKWYKTELYLQWPTNQKSYMIYRMATFSMTFNDPYLLFQGHAILLSFEVALSPLTYQCWGLPHGLAQCMHDFRGGMGWDKCSV